jgi:hypothetical protein
MKLTLEILTAALAVTVLVVFLARPHVPKVSGTPNYDAGSSCLRDVPANYNPNFFTFKTWILSWYVRHADKWGIKMSPDLLIFYEKYSELELEVDCYVQLSNDPDLNMALSSTDFKKTYNAIAKKHGLHAIK